MKYGGREARLRSPLSYSNPPFPDRYWLADSNGGYLIYWHQPVCCLICGDMKKFCVMEKTMFRVFHALPNTIHRFERHTRFKVQSSGLLDSWRLEKLHC